MKKKLIVIFLLMNLLTLVSCRLADAVDSQGNPIRISDYKGKWVVINYWAAWCKPCLKELPELNALYLIYKSRLMVFGVNYDALSNNEIETFVKKLGITFPMMRTFPMDKFGVQEISVLPVTFLISPEGKLVKTLKGPQTMNSLEKAMGIANKGYRIEERGLQKKS